MATIQERLNRMKQDGQAASVQQRLDQMKQDGQTIEVQKAPAVSQVQNTAVKQGGGGSGSAAPSAPAVTLPTVSSSVSSLPKPKTAQEVRAEMEQVLSSSAKRRTSQDIQAEMDGLDSTIGELKKQRDVLKSQAGLVNGRGGQGAGDYWAQLNGQTQALEKQIAQLESDRAGLQSQWSRADQTEFDLKMLRDPEYRAAVDQAMGADYGLGTVNSRKPAHRDVGYAMTYFQAKARGDEQLAASAMEQVDMALDRMSESQRNRLAWYVGMGDYDGAADYLNRIVPELNQAEAKDVEQTLSDWAQEHPIQGAAVNITSWPFNIPAYFLNAGQAVKNAATGKEEQNPHLSANVGTRIGTGTSQGTQQAARDAATQAFGSETAGEVASFLVGTGLSIGQNVSQIAMLGPGSLAAMSFSAAGSVTQDVLDRGGTPQQAFLVGTSAGAIEAITEKIPLDNLFRLASEGGGKGFKSAVIEALKEMGTEATEEMISEIANNLVDAAVMGESSECQMYVRELQEAGLSKEEAERAAFQQFYITNVLASGLGGAISGGVMGAGAMAFNKAGQYVSQFSGDTQSAQQTQDAIDQAYQAMAEKGMFSQEAETARAEAKGTLGLASPLLPTGETLRDARNGLYLPTAEQGTATLPGGEDAVQAPQGAGEGQKNAAHMEGTVQAYQTQEHHGNILDSVRTHLCEISEMQPVKQLTGGEFQKTDSDTRNLRTRVLEFFNSIGNRVMRPGFGDIALNNAGVRDSLGHGYGKLKAATFAALPDVLRDGKIIEYNQNFKGRDYESYLIAAPVLVGNETCYVGAMVIKDNKTQRYKLHEVLTIDKEGTPSFKTEALISESSIRDSAPENSISQHGAEVNAQQNVPDLDTAALTPEEQRRKDIQQVVQTLREDYAQGRINEEAFDGAMELIMEQEGFEGMDMLMEPVRGQGGTINGAETEQQLPGGREERALDQGAGGQAGGLAESGSRRAADTGRAAIERQNYGQALRLQAVSARELGIDSGTDAKTVRVLPESAWDSALRDTARKVRRETGKGVRFVLGGIQVTGNDGAVHQVRGAYTQDRIIVQADHMRVSPEQIADHEIFHDYARRDPGLVQAVEEAVVERYGQEEVDRMVDDYLKGLRGVVDMPEAGTDMDFEQAMNDVLNEIFADAYAGINAFGADAGKYQGEVLDTLEQRGVSDATPGREYAGAVEQRTGPPEMYSIDPGFADEIDSWDGQEIHTFHVGTTSEALQSIGVDNRNIILRSEKVKQILKKHTGMTLDVLKQVPQVLENPVMVLNSRSASPDNNNQSSRIVLLGEVYDSAGAPVTAILELRPTTEGGELQDFNLLVSAYGKNKNLHKMVEESDILYLDPDRNRTDTWLQGVQLQLPSYETKYGPMGSVSYEGGFVNVTGTPWAQINGVQATTENITQDPYGSIGQDPKTVFLRDASKHSVAETGGAVKSQDGVMLPTGEQGTVMAPRADDFGGTRFSVDDEQNVSNSDTSEEERIPDGLELPTLADITAQRDLAQSEVAQRSTENVSDSGTIEVAAAVDTIESPVDILPRKAQEYLKRAERQLTGRIGELLSVPRSAQRAFLQDIVREVSTEYLNTGKVSQETMDRLFEDAYDQGIEVDREYYDNYKHIRDYLRSTPITVSEWLKGDLDDYNGWRKGAFGTMRLVNKGGTDVETAYGELQRLAPELFPADVTHPGDQLRHILETAQGIRMTERSLDEYYGPDAEEFKRYTRRDFDEAVDDALRDLKQVKRYADERSKVKEGPRVPTSVQEVTALWGELKGARKIYEKAAARNLLTEHDEVQVGRLLRGELELADLDPSRDNVKGITAVFEAKQEYEDLAGRIREWNKQRKAGLMEQADSFLENAVEWKDKKAGILYARETMERNIRDIVPDRGLADQINRAYFQPVHEAAAKSNRAKNEYRDRVRDMDLSRKVAKGNTVSEAHAVQLLGEAEDNIRILEQSQGRVEKRDGKTIQEWQYVIGRLWEENPGLDQGKIREAVNQFRTIYDELFQQMNEARVRNGYEPVNYRQGYFPHFQPGSEGIMALFGRALGIDTAVDSLPTTINGLTHTFKPGIQWFGNAQERLGFNTAYDAVEGFDRYIEGVADVIYQTDNIQALRALASQVRYRTTNDQVRAQIDQVRARTDISAEEKTTLIDEINKNGKFSLGNFVVELDEYTNLLANKKSRGDRDMEQSLGRRMYKLMKGLEGRVAANMVAVNPASWLTNFVPLTQGAATLDRGMLLKGMWDTLKAYHTDDGFVGMSSFLTNRRGSDPLVKTWSQSASATLSSPMEYIDQFTSDSLVRARFEQNVKKGLSEAAAIEEADAWAAGVMADRSKGAMPTLFSQTNPVTKVFTQFQLEVNNQLSYLFKELPQDMKEKGLGALCAALLKFFVGAFLYNEVYEYFIGRRCALDPIGILNDSVGDFTGYELPNLVELGVGAATGKMPSFETEKQNPYEAVAGLAGNVAEELPFIGGVLGGGRVPISSALPDWENLGKATLNSDWSPEKRVSTAVKELGNPLTYLTLPFGGGQIKKIYQGLKAIDQGGSYTVDSQGNDVLQYPVYNETGMDKASNLAGALLFGKSSLPTARDWADSGYKSLSAKQTACYQGMTELGVSQRDAFELLQALGAAKGTEAESASAQKLRMLEESGISAEGKSVVYYGLMASEKERGLMDSLSDSGADMGEVTRVLMELKDANALESGKSDAKKEAITSSALSAEGKDAMFQHILSADSPGASWSAQLEDAGLDHSSAAAVANALNSLVPEEGRSTVAEVQQWRAVVDTAKGTSDQRAALLTVMSDSARMKYEIADSYGIEPEVWVQLKEALPQFDANGNGSYSGAEIENAIGALCGDGSLVAPWDKEPLRLSWEEKAVLWQLYTGSTSGKNNPYSSRVGNETGKALEKAKEEAKGEKE